LPEGVDRARFDREAHALLERLRSDRHGVAVAKERIEKQRGRPRPGMSREPK
jgi:hypothetical protein